MNVFQRYAHIFWIPFFPLAKTGVSRCDNCQQVLNLKQMPAMVKLGYDNLKIQTKTPWWHFSGIFLIALIAGAVTISQKQKAEKVSKLVLSPKKDDIFEVKVKEDVYTAYKVAKVEGDTVYFFANKLQTNRQDGLSDLVDKGPGGFATDSIYPLSKSTLLEMNKKEEIIDIDRN